MRGIGRIGTSAPPRAAAVTLLGPLGDRRLRVRGREGVSVGGEAEPQGLVPVACQVSTAVSSTWW